MRFFKVGAWVGLWFGLMNLGCSASSDTEGSGATGGSGATDAGGSASGGSATQGQGGAASGGGTTQGQGGAASGGSTTQGQGGAASGGAGTGGVTSGGVAGEGGAPAVTGSKIWTTTSNSIELRYFGFWEGGYGFRRSAEQLSTEQLELVEALETVPSNPACWSDSPAVSVLVGDEGGEVREYIAAYGDAHCDDSRSAIGWDGVSELLETAACLSAKGYLDKSDLGDDDPPVVHPGSGCLHGVFNGGATDGPWLYRVDVEAGRDYRIAVEQCRERELTLTIVDGDGVELESTLDESGDCLALEFTSSSDADTFFEMEMVGGSPLGDFFFSVEPLD